MSTECQMSKNLRPYPAYKPTGLAWLPEVPREWEIVRFKSLFRFGKGLMITKDDLTKDGCSVISYGQIHAKTNCGFHLDKSLLRFIPEKLTSEGSLLHEGDIAFTDTSEDIEGCGNCVSGNKVCLPPPAEQEAIVAYLDEKTAKIDRLIKLKKREIKLLNEKKQAVVSRVVTRGLDPNAELVDSGVDWIGKVPRGWRIRRLRYLGGCANGISKDGAAFGRGNPFVSYGDVYKNCAIPTQVTGLVESSESEQILYSVKRGDVFFTRTSETIDELGTAATCLATISKATFAGFLIRFRPNDDSLIPEFSKYCFRSPTLARYFRRTSGIVTRASLSQNLLKNLPVCIPPSDEQREIVAYLDAEGAKTDKAIAAVTRQIGLLKEYRTRLISDAVTGRIDLRG